MARVIGEEDAGREDTSWPEMRAQIVDGLRQAGRLPADGYGKVVRARGGASGDFLNAASDPRGFVKAELARPSGALLEVPGLQSTPALGKAVFDYQFEIQQARDAAVKSAAPASTESPPPQEITAPLGLS